jgi:type IV pilus assembly protein PilA
MLKKKLNDQRGMTLIELLAVIVILGIISAIAIPSILGLIDNSKRDAHVANAQQIINAAKLAVAGDEDLRPVAPTGSTTSTTSEILVSALETKGYLETIKDPDGTTYNATSKVVVTDNKTGKYSYSIYLLGTKKYIQSGSTAGTPLAENLLKRSSVRDN